MRPDALRPQHPQPTCCAWPPTTSTRACAAWARASGWRSTTSGLGIEALDADLVFLQEVRCSTAARRGSFDRTSFGWPTQPQADFLAPEGYEVAYRTNAVTRHGEHGNALLSRWPLGDIGHHDVSRPPLRAARPAARAGAVERRARCTPSSRTSGLMHASRVRQVERLAEFIAAEVPAGAPLIVAGDFNDWGERLDAPMREIGLTRAARRRCPRSAPHAPSRRGCRCSRSTASTRAG